MHRPVTPADAFVARCRQGKTWHRWRSLPAAWQSACQVWRPSLWTTSTATSLRLLCCPLISALCPEVLHAWCSDSCGLCESTWKQRMWAWLTLIMANCLNTCMLPGIWWHDDFSGFSNDESATATPFLVSHV